MPSDTVVFGEIGLSGEVRPVTHGDSRLKEAAKLGFEGAWIPRRPSEGGKGRKPGPDSMSIRQIGHLSDLVSAFPALPGEDR